MTTRVAGAKPSGNRFTRFFSGIWGEMRKVVWLNRREAAYLTMLVLLVSIAIGIILGGFDYGFSKVIDKILLGQ